jgi:8-oxo-dGTP diphosphatase
MEGRYVVNVDCAVVRDGEYLFIERAADKDHAAGALAFPGGRLDAPPGDADAVAATARREVREETGVRVGAVEYVYSDTFESDRGRECLNVVTLGEYDGGTAHPAAPDEVGSVQWIAPDDLLGRSDVPEFLAEYVERVEEARA